MTEWQKKRDKDDREELLRVVLEFLGVPEEEDGGRVIDKRDLPPEIEALVGDIERTLEVPVICRIVSK